jgi:endonuclease/exonuclease/phosphatase family metal-dependent hydrolase
MLPVLRRRQALVVVLSVLLLGALPGTALAVKIVSWNLLNYPGPSGPTRNPSFRVVVEAMDPDILVCQEVVGLSGAQAFRNDVLNVVHPNQWTLSTFSDGPDSDNALYIRSNAFTTAAAGFLNTWPRQVDWWQLRPAGNLNSGGDLIVYSAHLKAGTTSTDVEQRRVMARAIRDHMIATWPAGQPVLVVGDFNLYNSGEPAYGALTGNPGEDAQMFDPISTPGTWHDNAAFASIHTQSTRTASIGDGGATGGMDDRFDFILVDADLLDTESWDYIPGTYTAYGQDGLRFNGAVNGFPTNAAVGQTIADALHTASDHLPVFLELQTPARAQLLPTSVAFGSVLQGATVNPVNLQLRNAALAGSDELDFDAAADSPLSLTGTTSGELDPGQVAAFAVGLETSTPGLIVPNVLVSTDDPVNPLVEVPVTGRVVRASRPSWIAGADSLAITVQLTIADESGIENVVTVHNAGHDANQAALYVASVSFTGPDAARFSFLDAPAFFVLGTPVERRVAIDGSGLADGTVLQATLTLTVQDDFTVQGAQPRGPLVAEFDVEIDTGVTAVPPLVAHTTLHQPVPTPFNPRTTLSFDLARAGSAKLEVFDVRGRRVATLVDTELSAGRHTRVWDATDAAGAPLASGVYLVRFVADGTVEVRRAVLVR